jgi:hypothetical protein
MRIGPTLAALVVVTLATASAIAKSPDQEDWDAARKATCPELIDAYKTTVAAERKVVVAIKSSKDGTVAGNVLGVATLAIFGIGFFSWDDNASAEENLADLRHDLEIITTVAGEKKCQLPEVK